MIRTHRRAALIIPYSGHPVKSPSCSLFHSQSSRLLAGFAFFFARFSLLEVLELVEALGSPELAEPPEAFAPLEPDALPVEPEAPCAPVEPLAPGELPDEPAALPEPVWPLEPA